MISNQETLTLSPYMAIYDIVVPKANQLRKINELADFIFIHDNFLKKSKSHYKIEAKNSELKHGPGYETANSAGLFGMQITRGNRDICGEPQENYNLNEGSRARIIIEKECIRSNLNECTLF